jgi:CDP-6-deoxy-D-xylo-4-hexulose-3-dehydrase
MNNVFWVGVYPGLTKPMLDFAADKMTTFINGVAQNRELQAAFAQLD